MSVPDRSPSSQAVLKALLQRHGLAEPDGRPLYQYRARQPELEALRVALAEELYRPYPRYYEQMGLCLWAAEWWRRNYKSGPWKWEPLLATLGHPDFAPGGPRYVQLQGLVQGGMGSWKREVLRSGVFKLYLATLACEGGLPLSLVSKPTRLRSYLKAVMEEFRLFQSTSISLRDLAERAHHFLPRSWRQNVVYELAAQLVQQIVELQKELGDSPTPVRDLDRIRPGWRADIPVRTSDDVLRTLLNGLLLDAADVAAGGRIRVRWQVVLSPAGHDQWEAAGSWHIPTTLEKDAFNRLFGRAIDASVPSRFNLYVRTIDGAMQPLAVATPRRGEATKDTYGVEVLPSAREPQSADLRQARQLMAMSPSATPLEESFDTNDFPGAEGLTELPWVFSPDDLTTSRQPCRLVGQGSIKIREQWGFVAAQRDVEIEPFDDANVDVVGELRNFDRILYKITGIVAFVAGDDYRSVVETGASSSSTVAVEYRVHGRPLAVGRGGTPAFLGMPALREWCDGESKLVPEEHLEWKSDAWGARWQPYVGSLPVLGVGVLRYAKAGAVRYSTRICVLPTDAAVDVSPTDDPQRGRVVLRGFGAVEATVSNPSEVTSTGHSTGDLYFLDVTADSDPPQEMTIIADWKGHGRAQFNLPFPARRATFLDAHGRRLSQSSVLTEGGLAGARVEVVIPTSAEFTIQGSYVGTDTGTPTAPRDSMIVRAIPEVSRGYYALDLALVQPAVAQRLSRSTDLTGLIRLRVASNDEAGLLPPIHIDAARFDLDLVQCDTDSSRFRPDPTNAQLFSEEDMSSLKVEAVSLLDPDVQPVALSHGKDDTGWTIPTEELDPGQYLIVGRHGDWCRSTPRLWPSNFHDAQADPPRLDALTEVADAYARFARTESLDAFADVAKWLAETPDPSDPAWKLAFGHLRDTTLPVHAFPLLTALAESPPACAMAATVATTTDFELLWERLESYQVAWWLVPMCVWKNAFTAYAEAMEAALVAIEDEAVVDVVRKSVGQRIERITQQLPGLTPAFELMQTKLCGVDVAPRAKAATRPELLELFENQYRRHQLECPVFQTSLQRVVRIPRLTKCIRTLAARNLWSQRLFVDRVGQFSASVKADYADAPSVVAVAVLTNWDPPDEVVRGIRAVRDESPEWFEEALRLAELIAVGRKQLDRFDRDVE